MYLFFLLVILGISKFSNIYCFDMQPATGVQLRIKQWNGFS
jgi:hypothetical protein